MKKANNLKLTTGIVSFQNKKETDLANSIKGNISGKRLAIIIIRLVKVTDLTFSFEYIFHGLTDNFATKPFNGLRKSPE